MEIDSAPTKNGSSSWLPVLTTDEPFLELVKVGQHLPNGRQHLLEWEKQRRAEEAGLIITIDDDDSDDSDDIQSNTSTKRQKILKDIGKNPTEEGSSASCANSLTTAESFPTKWLVPLDDDDIGIDQAWPFVENGRLTWSKRSNVAASRRSNKYGNRKRKSCVFGSGSKEEQQQHWWKEEKQIQELIPSNPSGIVSVMGRRINMDRFANNDDDDTGVYSMLREWVKDDPEKHERGSPTTPAIDVPASKIHRKSLLRYFTMDTNNTNRDKSGVRGTTTTTAAMSSASSSKATVTATSTSAVTTTAKAASTPTDLNPPVCFLKWLDVHPDQRVSLPYYPTQREIRELEQQREAKRAAKIARKQRLARIKIKLKKKGIIL